MKGRVRWLLQTLPELVEQGVLDEQAAKRLHDHYLPHLDGNSTGMRMLVVLGALLMGLGVILLIAHNWPQWTRDIRTVVSFMPLVVGQLLVAWTLLRRNQSLSWREGSGTFLFLAIGASIGLIEQTYHLGTKEYASFLLTWLLLGLPLVYLLQATTPLLLYWFGVVGFAWSAQWQWGQAALFWLLWLAGLPFVVRSLREAAWSGRSLLLSWAGCLSLLCGSLAALEQSTRGLWIPFYATLFAGLYLTHYRWLSAAPDVLRSPFRMTGVAGILLMSLMLTVSGAWVNVGGHYDDYDWQYRETSGWLDWVLLAALFLWWMGLIRRVVRRREMLQFLYAGFPVLIMGLFCFAVYSGNAFLPLMVMNLYLFILGVATLRSGMRTGEGVHLNLGLLILCVLLMLRFFDSDLSFTVRGVAFFLIGAGFLLANLWLRRRVAS